jgi:RNA polymerase sigma-70 factor (ECF subfamily)
VSQRRREKQDTVLAAALSAVAGGDKAAVETLYEHTSAKLMGICLRILNDRQEAEDVLQDVYVSIWTRAGSFDPTRASPIAWLATIARNRAIDRLRARGARAQSSPVEEASEVADDKPDGFAAAAERQEGERIHYCLSTLEARAQEVIRAAFFDGLSYSDLARRAGVPLGTMKSWIRRGLQRMKTCLEA